VIGVAEPVSVRVETFGTSALNDRLISDRVKKVFDFRPGAIARDLQLLRPIYSTTAAGGHFGRVPGDDGTFPWEVIDESRIAKLQ
jgi:S-adenosylmethionine synthetase